MPVFIFDLDGTLTQTEMLPLIARHFNVAEDIAELTRLTVQGEMPYNDSFIARVGMLGQFPVDEVASLLEATPIFPKVLSFIQNNKESCVIATSNLTCWIHKLTARIGCACHASEADIIDGKIAGISSILKKEDIVAHYKQDGQKAVFIGDGHNDLEAMLQADIAIACGLAHPPAASLLAVADHRVDDESTLCRVLRNVLAVS